MWLLYIHTHSLCLLWPTEGAVKKWCGSIHLPRNSGETLTGNIGEILTSNIGKPSHQTLVKLTSNIDEALATNIGEVLTSNIVYTWSMCARD